MDNSATATTTTPRATTRWTPEEVKRARELYDNGMTLADVGKLYGVSRQRIYQIFEHSDGWERQRYHRTDTVRMVRVFTDAGMSIRDIAERLDMSPGYVAQICADEKISNTHGVRQRKTTSHLRAQEMHRLSEAGYTQKQIGDIYGIGQNAVSAFMRAYGFHLRERQKDTAAK